MNDNGNGPNLLSHDCNRPIVRASKRYRLDVECERGHKGHCIIMNDVQKQLPRKNARRR